MRTQVFTSGVVSALGHALRFGNYCVNPDTNGFNPLNRIASIAYRHLRIVCNQFEDGRLTYFYRYC